MAKLLSIFAEGAIHDEALEQALGVDTDGLDNAFRESLGLPPLAGTEAEPVEVSEKEIEEAQAVEEEAESAEVAEVAPASAEESTLPADEQAGATQASPETSETSANQLGFLPCVGGIIVILLMGGLLFKRIL
jgi:hypothetical protein